MDNFKKYIQQRQDEMDFDAPSDKVWKHIEKQTIPEKIIAPVKMIVRLVAAACTLAIIVLAIKWAVNDTATKPVDKEIVITKQPVITKPDISQQPDTIKTQKNIAEINIPAEKQALKKIMPKPATVNPYALMRSFENNYTQLVKMQMNTIRNTPVYGESAEYFNDFKVSLKQMDADEVAIRKNIAGNGINPAVLEKLINVYQQKLNLLKTLQVEINKMNDKVKENHAAGDSLSRSYINI